MKLPIAAIFLTLPALSVAADSQIDLQITKHSQYSLRAGSSIWPKVSLPKDASNNEILDCLKNSGSSLFKWYKIITSKKASVVLDHVNTLPNAKLKYPPIKKQITAVLIDTDIGRKIVFMHYDGPDSGWWTSVYSANQEAEQGAAANP